jgi:hypothetical protein
MAKKVIRVPWITSVILVSISLCILVGITMLYQSLRKDEKVLYVEAVWGLGNRLRTFNIAYELAKKLDLHMVIVMEDTFDERIFDAYPNDLFVEPDIGIVKKSSLTNVDYYKIEYNVEGDCSLKYSYADFLAARRKNTNLYIYCCGLRIPDLTIENIFYKQLKPTYKVMQRIEPTLNKFVGKTVVGVHIRQGSIGDYYYGNFFGDWDNKDDKPPTMCCYKDKTKNLSTCPESAPHLERFIDAMKKETSADYFFICSDRPGCLLVLEQEFPQRLLYNNLSITYNIDSFNAFCDWYCLSQCSKLILTGISSFSGEALKVKNSSHVIV